MAERIVSDREVMAGNTTVIPNERVAALQPLIEAQFRDVAARAAAEDFENIFDSSMRGLLVDGFALAGAHEGTVWLLDEAREFLVPRFNSGPSASAFVGSFRQTVKSGMISMIVATEQSICENEVCLSSVQDKTLDERLKLETWAMIAVPFYFAGELRGVISCVQLRQAGAANPPGFTADSLQCIDRLAGILSRLVEHRLLRLCLGWEENG